MREALGKLTRLNHQKHIVDVLPLITAVFGVQCYLMTKFESGISAGDLALTLGFGLASFVAGLFWYDKNHTILIYEDRIECGFAWSGRAKRIFFQNIELIKAPEEEKNFSSLIFKMKEGPDHIFYFVDFPKASKEFIDEQIEKFQNAQSSEDDSNDKLAA